MDGRATVGALLDENLLSDGLLHDEFVCRAIDDALHEPSIDRGREDLFRFESPLSEIPREIVQGDSAVRLDPSREGDERPLPPFGPAIRREARWTLG
jgi:hypothetical protein